MPIIIDNLHHEYMPDTPFAAHALNGVSLRIDEGEAIGIIGHTGSGKSTLIQHFNGLLKPTSGSITVDGSNLSSPETIMKDIRRKVGLVFQYPEYQLFEETVEKDVAFGPKNLGISEEEISDRVREAISRVGVDYDWVKDRSPFELSGGQKRRIAIAGVLAMRPQYLVLDEPAAGLDPRGRDELLELISSMHERDGITIVMVSHNMDDISRIANRIIVMNKGSIAFDAAPREVFMHDDVLRSMGMSVPAGALLKRGLIKRGIPGMPEDAFSLEELSDAVAKALTARSGMRGDAHA